MQSSKTIKLEVGKRVLYCVDGSREILEGVIAKISPSGEVIKIGDRWYCKDGGVDTRGPIAVKILDELGAEPKRQVVIEEPPDNDLTRARR
jgi:hypothetical protein